MGNIIDPAVSAVEDLEIEDTCNIYKRFRKTSNGTFLGLTGHEGIPQNFLVMSAAWLGFITVFILMRKKLWNFGRAALMKKDEKEWTDMFYQDSDLSVGSANMIPVLTDTNHPSLSEMGSNGSSMVLQQNNRDSPEAWMENESERGRLAKPIRNQEKANGESSGEIGVKGAGGDDDREAYPVDKPEGIDSKSKRKVRKPEMRDKGYFSWIKIVYNLTDEDYRTKCGEDSVYYISFQRHLILIVLIMTITSMGIILPINLHKSFSHENADMPIEFSDTTIINLDTDYKFVWAHVVLAIVYLIISVSVMRRYSKRLQFTKKSEHISNTIIIRGIRENGCREELLRMHFAECYPEAEITEISFAYDVSEVQPLEFKKLSAASAKLYSYEKLKKEGKRPTIRPYFCGNCCNSGCCKETDAIDYYTKEEQKYIKHLDEARREVISHPLDIAFVTFIATEHAERVVEDYKTCSKLFLYLPTSQYTKRLGSSRWSVKFASPPSDIYWENLSTNTTIWYIKSIVVNLLLTICVVIFTTPVYLFTTFFGPQFAKHKLGAHAHKNSSGSLASTASPGDENPEEKIVEQMTPLVSLIVDSLPITIISILSSLLVIVVSSSDVVIGYWCKTSGNRSEMIKTFFFLAFMVMILPSLGVTSLSYFLSSKNHISWSCIFYKDNGALFINYEIACGLMGSGADLLRIPELVIFIGKIWFAKSTAEIGSIRKSVLWEFPLGIFYAWTLLHFALISCFCLIYPLITPFGLICLVFKHWTDRYNLYFGYKPCNVNKEIHRTAIHIVIMCVITLQINLLGYVHFHLGEIQNQETDMTEATNPGIRCLQVFTLLSFAISSSLIIGQARFHICEDFGPVYQMKSPDTDPPILPMTSTSISNSQEDGDEQQMDSYYEPLRESTKVRSKLNLNVRPQNGEKWESLGTVSSEATTGVDQGMGIIKFSETQTTNNVPSNITLLPYANSQNEQPETEPNHLLEPKPYGRYIPQVLRPEFVRLWEAKMKRSYRNGNN